MAVSALSVKTRSPFDPDRLTPYDENFGASSIRRIMMAAKFSAQEFSLRIAYLDCFSGISGDMLLGALVDAGVPISLLEETARALDIGAEIVTAKVDRNGITATKIDVVVDGLKDAPLEDHEHSHDHSHEHNHVHEHGHGHGHAHPHTHENTQTGTTVHVHEHKHSQAHESLHDHRGLKEIREIINGANIANEAKTIALKAFHLLAEAEAKVHNKDLESIHFHEVGSTDAIVDIVCGAVAAHSLNIDLWICSPLNVGGGTVRCAHGTLPVPAPATLELLRDAPIYSNEIRKELVTPTGAAMVRALVTSFGSFPTMRVANTGYGAGLRNFPIAANVLRVTIGESASTDTPLPRETITVIEANLDDMSPEIFGYVIEKLLNAGALDAFGVPVQMKKSRPGVILTVLARAEDTQNMANLIFAETTTIGIRMRKESRQTLAREHESVVTKWGEVRIKIARLNGTVTNAAPEFEDCKRIASASGAPLKSVMQEAMRLYAEAANN